MPKITPNPENRKIDLPPLATLVWNAVMRLPDEQGMLLRALLTKGHDFQQPKRGHVVRDLAAHMGVTDRTIRNWIGEALANPILHKAALGALPEIGVERAGIDQSLQSGGRSVRAWSSDTGPERGGGNADREPQRSRHDRTRGNWAWSAKEDLACRRGVPLVPYRWPLEFRREPLPERGICLPCRKGGDVRLDLRGFSYPWYKRRRQRSKGAGRVVLSVRREFIAPPHRAKVWRLIVEPAGRVEYDGTVYWRPGLYVDVAAWRVKVAAARRQWLIYVSDWRIDPKLVRVYGRRRTGRPLDYAWLGRGQRAGIWFARSKLAAARRAGVPV